MTKPLPSALAPVMLTVSIAGLGVILPVSAQPKKAFMICAATPAITRPTPHFSKARSVLRGASAISRSLRVINSPCASAIALTTASACARSIPNTRACR